MNEACYICGEIREPLYEFKYRDFAFGYVLKFCHDCGEPIKQNIEHNRLVHIRKNARSCKERAKT